MKGFAGRCRAVLGRCGPAVTLAVEPMLPAAGLLEFRRRSSACAAARPGAPAGHRTRRPRLRRQSRAPSGAVGGAGRTARRRPLRIGGPDWASGASCPNHRPAADVSVLAAVAGTCRPRLRITVLFLLLDVLFCASARLGASVPWPRATSAKPAALAHVVRARCRRPAAQCPAPTAAWVTTGATGSSALSATEGLTPSRRDKEDHPPAATSPPLSS